MESKLILIVNYKKSIEETQTYQSLKKIENELKKMNYTIFIWDNCFLEHNAKICENENWIKYKGSKENCTLSYIYNKVIDEELNKINYFIILDNDTTLTIDYFLEFEKCYRKNKDINLFLPKVLVENNVFSPQKIFYELPKKNERIDKKLSGKIEAKNFTAINSGMIISVEYLKKNKKNYDEDLGFYGTDNFFMFIYQKRNEYIYILNYIMSHDLSMQKKENLEIALWRFKDQVKGIKILSGYLNLNGKILNYLKMMNLMIKNILKYKTFKFFN